MKAPLSAFALLLLAVGPAAAEERFHTTPSGLKYEILNPGEPGTRPKGSEIVEVHFVVKTKDGKKLQSTRDAGQAWRFFLGRGPLSFLDECAGLMDVGARFKLYVPKARAEKPVDQDLIFEVELVRIIDSPRFSRPDPEKQVTTPSGLKYEVLQAGGGAHPGPDENVRMRFALWNTAGAVVICTEAANRYIVGQVSKLGFSSQAPIEFLTEAARLMRPGAVYRFEVPPGICFGEHEVSKELPGNSTTIWELELLEILSIPAFRVPDEEKQVETKSGLAYEVLEEGEGPRPKATDTVTVHYVGWLEDGTSFDSSYSRGEPATFPLGGVIRGWTEGLQLMKVGSVYRFVIPWKLAYGERGRPPTIPPRANLVFQIELIRIGK